MGLELATQESRSTDWVSQPGSLPTIWFWLAFPLWLMMLMIFSCPYWSFVGPLWRNVYSNLLLIFKLGYFSFYQDTCSLYILYTRSLIRNVICKKKKKKDSYSVDFTFTFIDGVLWCRFFSSDYVQCMSFLLLLFMLWCYIQGTSADPKSWKFTPVFLLRI